VGLRAGAEEKFLALSEIESPAVLSVAIPTELSRLHRCVTLGSAATYHKHWSANYSETCDVAICGELRPP
jgi:hypothetical protein